MAEENLFLRVYQTLVGLVGIFGNALVCLVIAKIRSMHTLTNGFIFNQALIDLLGSLMILLYSLVPVPDPLPPGAAGQLLCKLWQSGYFRWALFIASTVNLEALTAERYLAIVFPFRYQALATPKTAAAVVVAAWVVGFVYTSFNIYMHQVESGRCLLKPVPHGQVLGVAGIFVIYIIPVSIMLVVYVHIAVVLKKGAARIQPGPAAAAAGRSTGPAPEGQGESLMRARRNTFKTLLLVCVAFTVCWTPNAILAFLFGFNIVSIDLDSFVFIASVALVATNSCVNPFIYAIKYKQFRAALKSLVGKRGAPEAGPTVTAQTALP